MAAPPLTTAFAFRHGPDGLLGHVHVDGSVASAEGTPFHGIISRGLLEMVRASPELAAAWARSAHRLHAMGDGDDAALGGLRAAARDCGVLALGQSAACAREYAARYCRAATGDEPVTVELWNIKEGHTSSVWRVAMRSAWRREEFVVNVARDRAAGVELLATSRAMQRVTSLWPDANMARVLDISMVDAGVPGITEPIPVTRNEWIADSYEIYRLGQGAPTGGARELVLVERFVAARHDEPWRIHAIVGRLLTAAECRRVDDDVRRFVERVGDRCAICVDIDDGDVVWNGEGAVVVAVAEAAGRECGANNGLGDREAMTCPNTP